MEVAKPAAGTDRTPAAQSPRAAHPAPPSFFFPARAIGTKSGRAMTRNRVRLPNSLTISSSLNGNIRASLSARTFGLAYPVSNLEFPTSQSEISNYFQFQISDSPSRFREGEAFPAIQTSQLARSTPVGLSLRPLRLSGEPPRHCPRNGLPHRPTTHQSPLTNHRFPNRHLAIRNRRKSQKTLDGRAF